MAIKLDKVFDVLINKMHILLGVLAQAAILGYHFKTGKDIGPGVQGTMYAYYGFLLGHAGVYQKWPDKAGDDKEKEGSPS